MAVSTGPAWRFAPGAENKRSMPGDIQQAPANNEKSSAPARARIQLLQLFGTIR
jgi:hypothetical protein